MKRARAEQALHRERRRALDKHRLTETLEVARTPSDGEPGSSQYQERQQVRHPGVLESPPESPEATPVRPCFQTGRGVPKAPQGRP